MKEWLGLKETSRLAWLALARESLEFVSRISMQEGRESLDKQRVRFPDTGDALVV